MAPAICEFLVDRMTIRPTGRTGWWTILDHTTQELSMQFLFSGLGLPLRRRIPYSKIVRVRAMPRQRGVRLGAGTEAMIDTAKSRLASAQSHELPPSERGRFDILISVEEGIIFRIPDV
ncbi:MAG: hypothetical protein NTU41_11955, partial [Chloroflexi bacterium]|nr:hypothetical protein [Chloroflexota bacterium]